MPCVPFLPGISVLANTYLILKLSWETWIRFAVWMAIGFIFYAVCLFNGTTDKAYQKSVDKRQRKYSKVSANGFRNTMFQLNEKPEGGGGGPGNTFSMQNLPTAVSNSNATPVNRSRSSNNDPGSNRSISFSTFLKDCDDNSSMPSRHSTTNNDHEDPNDSEILQNNESTRKSVSEQQRQNEFIHEEQPESSNLVKDFCQPPQQNNSQFAEVGQVAQELVDSVIAVANSQLNSNADHNGS